MRYKPTPLVCSKVYNLQTLLFQSDLFITKIFVINLHNTANFRNTNKLTVQGYKQVNVVIFCWPSVKPSLNGSAAITTH